MQYSMIDLLAPFFNCLFLSRNFGQPETGPTSHFRFCFPVIRRRTFQLKHEGGGVCLWITASQDNLVGLIQLTILSGQGHISELVVIFHISKERFQGVG